MTTWQEFVMQQPAGTRADYLAAAVARPIAEVRTIRRGGRPGRPRPGGATKFPDVFSAWRGRAPRDAEWPRPLCFGGDYEWQPPELALLARLCGRVGSREIARVLTTRLRRVTGDRAASRSMLEVQLARNRRLHLTSGDVVGGLTPRQAGEEIGSVPVVQQAIHDGRLRTLRVGPRHVIPCAVWAAFKAKRDAPPVGWIRLSTLRKPLGIASDSKLPEYAKFGFIPDVVMVRSHHAWFIHPGRAREILEAAREGRPLPWHGKPHPANTVVSWKKWQRRRHRWCRLCTKAWGRGGTPRTFADFARRYPPIDLGLKRHMTHRLGRRHKGPRRPWGTTRAFRGAGVTIAQAARALERTVSWVRIQIRRGVVRPVRCATDPGQALRITEAGMAKLRKARGDEFRGRPPGVWLGLHLASRHAGVSNITLERWRKRGLVRSKPGTRGRLYALTTLERQARVYWRWACAHFRRPTPPAWLIQEAA